MSQPKRHIGKMTNTDQRCVVVYMQIPGRESHSLVVGTDNLPLSIESYLMQVLESPEGQADPTLANVLGRRTMPDTGVNLLQTLHNVGLLQAIPIDNIVMLPMPNMPIPLRQIITDMGGKVPEADAPPEAPLNEREKFNPYGQTQQTETSNQNRGIASNLLVEANLLEQEAQRKRDQAYQYDPTLRPQALTPVEAAPAPIAIEITDGSEKTVEKGLKKPARSRSTKGSKTSA